ncbi:MAG: hypothetical protein U5N26_09135 [Candidatus Marinimicrobia bacterium]|nr:hypothetical protein [Candidatus Neomarinimicrobiota bacterium]
MIDTSSIRFSWEAAIDVDEHDIVTYALTVTDADMNVVLETETETTGFSWDSPLNGSYEWKVEARDIAEAVTESGIRGFTVDVLSLVRVVPAEFALLAKLCQSFQSAHLYSVRTSANQAMSDSAFSISAAAVSGNGIPEASRPAGMKWSGTAGTIPAGRFPPASDIYMRQAGTLRKPVKCSL